MHALWEVCEVLGTQRRMPSVQHDKKSCYGLSGFLQLFGYASLELIRFICCMHDPVHACVPVQMSGHLFHRKWIWIGIVPAWLFSTGARGPRSLSEALARGYTFCTLIACTRLYFVATNGTQLQSDFWPA
jgi:hypothetical protein